jgi:uncharacterized protein
MYSRLLTPATRQSFFLFGPRGVGKTAWLHEQFPDAPFFDLLDADTCARLSRRYRSQDDPAGATR